MKVNVETLLGKLTTAIEEEAALATISAAEDNDTEELIHLCIVSALTRMIQAVEESCEEVQP